MSNPDVMYDEAHKLKQSGDLEGAVAKLKAIVEAIPEHVLSHSALAVYLQKLGKPHDAIAHAKKVVELEPDNPQAHAELSVISQRCGLIQEAEDALATSHETQTKPQGGG